MLKSVANETDTAVEPCLRAWLQATAAGDRSAFEQLYRHCRPRLSRFVLRCCGRQDLADEVVNEALWVVWRTAGNFRGESRVTTWVHGIAYRCMLKALRDGVASEEINASSVHEAELAMAEPSVNEGPDRELRNWLARGLSALPMEQRVTLELAYYLGESCEDIARIMNCATGTVKARMFHARIRLRNVLPELGGVSRPMSGTEGHGP
jgi:RNA polymerase sigma-70 factor, ECF subfamily